MSSTDFIDSLRDFSELTTTVETLDLEVVYTQHGFSDEFATDADVEWTSTRARSNRQWEIRHHGEETGHR